MARKLVNREKTIRAILLDDSEEITPGPKYKAQKLEYMFSESEFTTKVRMLPFGHVELNLIEMVWSDLKLSIAGSNFELRLSLLELRAEETLVQYVTTLFEKSFFIMNYLRNKNIQQCLI